MTIPLSRLVVAESALATGLLLVLLASISTGSILLCRVPLQSGAAVGPSSRRVILDLPLSMPFFVATWNSFPFDDQTQRTPRFCAKQGSQDYELCCAAASDLIALRG